MKVRPLPERPGVGRLGRHVEHDPASRRFEATTKKAEIRRQSWARCVPIFDQGELGSCTGNAITGIAGCAPHYVPGARLVDEALAVEVYRQATRLDKIAGHYPPDDTGSSGLAAAKAATRLGLFSAYHHSFTLKGALAAISNVGPIAIGINWYEGFDRPIGNEARLEIAGEPRGGHEVLLRTVDPTLRIVVGDNSWGASWGLAGSFSMSWDTLERLLAEDGDSVVPLPR